MADEDQLTVDDTGRFFWSGLQRGVVLLATCRHCGLIQHPPSPMCPRCGSLEWDARQASGRGTVLSWIVSHHPTQPDDEPRVVVLVELEEGARVVGNFTGADQAANDLAVEAVFTPGAEKPMLLFRAGSRECGLMASRPGATAIAGIGQTEFSKDSGRSELQLAAEAVRAAIDDAGSAALRRRRHGHLHPRPERRAGPDAQRRHHRLRAGPPGRPSEAAGRRPPLSMRPQRWPAERPRRSSCIGPSTSARVTASASPSRRPAPASPDWYLRYGLDTPAKMYSLWFQSYMHRFGLTNADFGRYTVVARAHAATNPNAWFYERPITLEDHQASRWIVEPILRLLDCCQESDGGVACVVTSAETRHTTCVSQW